MRASVIIRSKDEADRLKLTLRSLSRQTEPAEIVVVNDGSIDHTEKVVTEAADSLQLVRLDNAKPMGRSGAANAGAELASGDVLIFLDGDTLAGPELRVQTYGRPQAHARRRRKRRDPSPTVHPFFCRSGNGITEARRGDARGCDVGGRTRADARHGRACRRAL